MNAFESVRLRYLSMTDLLQHAEFLLASTLIGTCSIAAACLGIVAVSWFRHGIVLSLSFNRYWGVWGAENETVHSWVQDHKTAPQRCVPIRATKLGMGQRRKGLYEIVADIRPMTVRQAFYQGTVRELFGPRCRPVCKSPNCLAKRVELTHRTWPREIGQAAVCVKVPLPPKQDNSEVSGTSVEKRPSGSRRAEK
jgi:hypothetical protein